MSKIWDNLREAAAFACKEKLHDERCFWIGSIGERADGARVRSRNGSAEKVSPELHAEARLLKKLDFGSTVYVARVIRMNHALGMARPCRSCRAKMRAKGVKKVFYTISDQEYGVLDLSLYVEQSRPQGVRLPAFHCQRWQRGTS